MVDFATLVLGAETARLKKAEPALDAVIAKAGKADAAAAKLGASAKAMGVAAQTGATQAKTAIGTIETEAQQAAVAVERTSASLDGMAVSAARAGNAAGASAGQVGNLTAQVFDISMMMQAGQNPFQLMLQQGSQVAQVLGPMGASGALQAFKGVFASLISPVNLLTFGIIGLSAAIVPMIANFLSGGAAAEQQTAALERQKEIITGLAAATEDLRIKREMLQSGASSTIEQEGMNEVNRLLAEREAIMAQLAAQQDEMVRAAGIGAQTVAQAKDQELRSQLAVVDAQLKSYREEENRLAAVERSKAMAELFQSVMQQAANMNLNGPWQTVLGSIQNAINKANEYRSAMAQGNYLAELARTGQSSGPDSARSRVQFGGGAFRAPVTGAGLAYEPPKKGGSSGGGTGGGSGRSEAAAEAEKEAEAIQKVVDKLKSEVEQVGMTAEARRLHQELQRAGVDIYSKEGQQIAALVEQLTALEAKQKLVAETMKGIENAAQGFFVGVLSGAKDLKSAIGDLLKQLGNLFLNQAFKMLWDGKAGGKGGLGGLIAGLFDAGGRIPAGQVGLVAEKRPEVVDDRLITRPTLISGPANVTGGAATARMMGVPGPQGASPRRSASQAMPQPRVNVAPAPVIVLDDPRKIDAFQRSPAGERAAAWQNRRMNRG